MEYDPVMSGHVSICLCSKHRDAFVKSKSKLADTVIRSKPVTRGSVQLGKGGAVHAQQDYCRHWQDEGALNLRSSVNSHPETETGMAV